MHSYENLTYQYDNGGNITLIGDALWSGGGEFAYDDLSRLTQASGNFGPNLTGVTHSYTYDAIGNVLTKAGVSFYYCGHPDPLHAAQAQYCPDPLHPHPSAVVNTSDGNIYSYDYNGNTATGAGRTYTWNPENRLAELSAPGGTVISTYDHTGTRIKKAVSGAPTFYHFAGYEVGPSGVTKYIRIGIEIIAANTGGVKRFYHNDHQGGVNIITDIWGGIVQVNEYDPWGKVTRSEGNVEPTKRFNGKELDEESGLYYYGARYYDPNLMRFVSPDPFIQEPGNPQNFNRYSYTINNPQKYVDPSGHFFGLIFSLIFSQATASKLWAASDPFGFLLSKMPKKANGIMNIFGGVAMMLTGNPAGAFYVASGALSFGKGSGFQLGSQLLGFAGAVSTIAGVGSPAAGPDPTCGVGCDILSQKRSMSWNEAALAANALAQGRSNNQRDAVRDVDHLKRMIYGEGRGEPLDTKLKLGWTGRNRLESGVFGQTYEDVLKAPGQFAYYRGHIPDSAESREAFAAALEVYYSPSSANPVPGVTYFYSPATMWPPYRVPPWVDWKKFYGALLNREGEYSFYLFTGAKQK